MGCDSRIPDSISLTAQEIAGGAQTRIRISHSILKERTVADRRARVESALVSIGECDNLGDRALCNSNRDRTDMQGGVKQRLRHRRCLDTRASEKNIEAVGRGYREILDRDVMAAGPAKSVDRPGVEDLRLRRREHNR